MTIITAYLCQTGATKQRLKTIRTTVRSLSGLVFGCMLLIAPAQAGSAVKAAAPDAQQAMLQSDNPQLMANKKLVYDFWRVVLEAGQLEQAPLYLSEGYIQHNPNIADGRAAFVAFFAKFTKQSPVKPEITSPLVHIMAEGAYVTLVFVQTLPDPTQPGKTYTTTAFDMFRVSEGKIVEHWDSMQKS